MIMEISKTLENAIETKNVSRIRSAFYTIAHEDPGFSSGKFRNTLNYVKTKNIPGLFDPYDGAVFEDETKWTKDYWAKVASDLVDNFCEERIEHLQKVGAKLYPTPVKKNVSEHPKSHMAEKSRVQHESHQQKKSGSNLMVAAAVVVIVIVIVVLLLVRR